MAKTGKHSMAGRRATASQNSFTEAWDRLRKYWSVRSRSKLDGSMRKTIPRSMRKSASRDRVLMVAICGCFVLGSVGLITNLVLKITVGPVVADDGSLTATGAITAVSWLVGWLGVYLADFLTAVSDDNEKKLPVRRDHNAAIRTMGMVERDGWNAHRLSVMIRAAAPIWLLAADESIVLKLMDAAKVSFWDSRNDELAEDHLVLDGEQANRANHLIELLIALPESKPDVATVTRACKTVDAIMDSSKFSAMISDKLNVSLTDQAEDVTTPTVSAIAAAADGGTSEKRFQWESKATRKAKSAIDSALARLEAMDTIASKKLIEQRMRLEEKAREPQTVASSKTAEAAPALG